MYELLVGLEVSNDEMYSDYRSAIKPLLKLFGGRFGFDLVVSEVLHSDVDEPINRIFTIQFPGQTDAEAFFSDSEYLKVKAQYFDASVSNTTIISSYERAT
ncbi:DUF1330 domain-containing protein [Vibrio sp. HN007]|uniref:DUF1330 domain-containing protein n=1 Tax=Vibrio iocasae TaxID=3098914 RepID=UPI0035D4A21A